MSSFTFIHNVFYAVCILKSCNNHISVVLCSFFEFQTGVLGNGLNVTHNLSFGKKDFEKGDNSGNHYFLLFPVPGSECRLCEQIWGKYWYGFQGVESRVIERTCVTMDI